MRTKLIKWWWATAFMLLAIGLFSIATSDHPKLESWLTTIFWAGLIIITLPVVPLIAAFLIFYVGLLLPSYEHAAFSILFIWLCFVIPGHYQWFWYFMPAPDLKYNKSLNQTGAKNAPPG